jgi:hypothetical protein
MFNFSFRLFYTHNNNKYVISGYTISVNLISTIVIFHYVKLKFRLLGQ